MAERGGGQPSSLSRGEYAIVGVSVGYFASPKLVNTNEVPLPFAAPGAHRYGLMGIEIHTTGRVYGLNLYLGSASAARLPRHLVSGRVFAHGSPEQSTNRGIALDCVFTTSENPRFRASADTLSASREARPALQGIPDSAIWHIDTRRRWWPALPWRFPQLPSPSYPRRRL